MTRISIYNIYQDIHVKILKVYACIENNTHKDILDKRNDFESFMSVNLNKCPRQIQTSDLF